MGVGYGRGEIAGMASAITRGSVGRCFERCRFDMVRAGGQVKFCL